MRSVCVFCGSSVGLRPEYGAAAREIGTEIARRGWRLVFGGGQVGLMGAVADAALAAGGEVVGVIPEALLAKELGHGAVTTLHVTTTMHERKALMAELSDGFVGLPGGFGTFDELCEMLTWAQLGIHGKPVGLLDIAGYWQPLLALVDHAVREGFVDPDHRHLILTSTDPATLLDTMIAYIPPPTPKWADRRDV